MIKSGDQKSGEITSNGSYGHYALLSDDDTTPETPVVLLSGHTFVTAGADIPDNDDTYRWFGAYVVTGLPSNSVRVQIITTVGNVIQDMSHIDYLFTCDEPETGCISISKTIEGDIENGSYTFKFDVYDSPTDGSIVGNLSNLEITIVYPAGTTNSAQFCDPALVPDIEYYVEEVDDAGMTMTTPASGRVAVTAVASGNTTNVATFVNDPKDDPEKGKIIICKTYIGTGDAPDFFNFTITGPGAYSNSVQVAPGKCVELKNLEFGTYTVTETDTNYDVVITGGNNSPKSGLSPLGDTVTIVDEEGQREVTIAFENDPTENPLGIIGVEKVDEKGRILTKAGFTLFAADGTTPVRSEQMVDAAGKVAFKNLPLGTYVLSETTVPPGVSAKMADTTVVIDAGNVNRVITVTAVNKRGGGDGDGDEEGEITVLALTGFNMVYYIAGFLLIFIGAIGSIYLTRTLRRREE